MRKLVTFALIVCMLPYLTGCEGFKDYTLTGHLWDMDAVPDQHAPATQPNLSVFQDLKHNDLLVQYDEETQGAAGIHRRAYYLNKNEKRINAGKKPHFVNPATSRGLDPVPVSTNALTLTNIAGSGSIQVVIKPDNHHFSVVSGGHELAQYSLPIYPDWGSRGERIALTPLAVAGDVVIYAAITAAIAAVFYVWAVAQGGHTINT